MFFFLGGGEGLYFFLLLLFVFISPPPPPFIPTAQNLYIHPTSTPTDPTSAAPVASSPLYAWGAVGRGLHPHCWGADIPPPHPPFTLGRAGRSCMLPEETFPSASSTLLLLLVSIGFSFRGGGFVLIILLLPSQIKTHPASSVSHLVAGQQWGALAVGSFITCSVGFFFLGGGERCMGFPPAAPTNISLLPGGSWRLLHLLLLLPKDVGGGALILKLAGLGAGSGCVPTLPPPCVPVGSQH